LIWTPRSEAFAEKTKFAYELCFPYTLGYQKGTHSLLATVEAVGTDGMTAMPKLSLGYTTPSFATDGPIVTMKAPLGRTPGDKDVSLADLDGDGLPDLLVTHTNQFRSHLNWDGLKWDEGKSRDVSDSPSVALSDTGVQLAEVDGDGALDLLTKSGSKDFRFLPGKNAKHFGAAVAIATVPNFTFEDPEVRLAELQQRRFGTFAAQLIWDCGSTGGAPGATIPIGSSI
jgi:hypothetical protein